MPCRNPLRWSLGASALVAVVVAGCGAASSQQKPSLHASAEERLLSLVARARVDATAHDGTAVQAVLGEFVSEVQTLRSSGQLTGPTALNLDRQARSTAAQAARQLHPAARKVTTAAAEPAAQTTPTPPANITPSPATRLGQQNNQGEPGNGGNHAPWPRDHGKGHRFGSARSSAVRDWIDSAHGWQR